MGTEERECPSCGQMVDAGSLVCPHCGINVRTGEVYELKVERAKGKEALPEHFGLGMALGLVLAFGLVLLSGFLYQRRTERVIKQQPEQFAGFIIRLEQMDGLAVAGDLAEARELGEELISELTDRVNEFQIEVASGTGQKGRDLRRTRNLRRAEKSLLQNIAKKAQHKLNRLPTGAD